MEGKLLPELINHSVNRLKAIAESDKVQNFNVKGYDLEFIEDIELKTSTIKKLILASISCGLKTGLCLQRTENETEEH